MYALRRRPPGRRVRDPRNRLRRAGAALLSVLIVCAALPVPTATAAPVQGDEDTEDPAVTPFPDPDPWEPVNRGIFWFNEKSDIYVVAPVARGWRFVVPGFARTGVRNFNGLLLMPVVFVNGLLQLKPVNAFQDLGRIVYNATFGIAGLIDVATMIGIPQNDEDFGQSLGFWGVPPGPYVVIPLFGPSNVRDAVGRLGDTAGTFYFSLLPIWVTFIVRGVDLIDLRSRYLEEVDENRRESFDYYVFLRDAYLQNRRARVDRARGEEEEARAQDDLYYIDDPEDVELDDEAEDRELDEGALEDEEAALDGGAPEDEEEDRAGEDVDDVEDVGRVQSGPSIDVPAP